MSEPAVEPDRLQADNLRLRSDVQHLQHQEVYLTSLIGQLGLGWAETRNEVAKLRDQFQPRQEEEQERIDALLHLQKQLKDEREHFQSFTERDGAIIRKLRERIADLERAIEKKTSQGSYCAPGSPGHESCGRLCCHSLAKVLETGGSP